jgi:hypothetical protein
VEVDQDSLRGCENHVPTMQPALFNRAFLVLSVITHW